MNRTKKEGQKVLICGGNVGENTGDRSGELDRDADLNTINYAISPYEAIHMTINSKYTSDYGY